MLTPLRTRVGKTKDGGIRPHTLAGVGKGWEGGPARWAGSQEGWQVPARA